MIANKKVKILIQIKKHYIYLFKGIVKVTKKSLKEKKTPETQSNIVNTNNNILDFTYYVYNNEEHLDNDKSLIIKSPKKQNIIKSDKIISLSPTLKSKTKTINKYKSSLELFDFSKNISKEKNLKKSLFNKNYKQLSLYCNISKSKKNLNNNIILWIVKYFLCKYFN